MLKDSRLNDNCFDIIRCICTFTVFLGHFLADFQVESAVLTEIAYCVRGVPVFFFLSGLFISRSLERYSTKEYLLKRLVRIYPELWVCVLLNLGLILLSGVIGSFRDLVIYLGTQLTVFQFYTGAWLKPYGVGVPNGALWTITVDVQFYLAVIVIAKLLKGKRVWVWLASLTGLMALDWVLEAIWKNYPLGGGTTIYIYKLLQCSIVPFLWIFLAGMFIYRYGDVVIPKLVRLRTAFLALYIAWQYAVPAQIRQLFEGIRYNIVTTTLLICVVASIGFSTRYRMKREWSYSFYLYHIVVINALIQTFAPSLSGIFDVFRWFLLTALCTCVCAILSHYLVAVKLTGVLEFRLISKHVTNPENRSKEGI